MNKLELVKKLKEECEISKKEAATVVDLFFGKISDTLAEGDRVEIRGLCSFFVKEYQPYQGRNPLTGERVQVAPKKLPFFKCGRELKRRVDY
ncbi:MAG: integration host factor subunit beta [Deltaproteobacteria bacterium]|nr:integration host factor subunit beta [Deltaproteobacteria bacterium]